MTTSFKELFQNRQKKIILILLFIMVFIFIFYTYNFLIGNKTQEEIALENSESSSNEQSDSIDKNCKSNPDPIFTNHITDLSKIDAIGK